VALSTIIAVVFDFDDTLVPDSTTMLLKKYGVDPSNFWQKDLKALVRAGYDPTLGYLSLLLELVGPGKAFGALSNRDLREFGTTLDQLFHSGLPTCFDELRSIVQQYQEISIEFYVVSGGLRAVIEGSSIVQKYFAAIYGCELAERGEPPILHNIQRAINFTEKTRYLFEINKGLRPDLSRKNPYLVNKDIPKTKRRIPFKNMIYVGDGLTDVPCFSMVSRFGGTCFGVFDPTDETKAKRALLEFLKPKRVISMHSPRYGKNDDLGSLLRAAVSTICTRMVLDQQTAEYEPDSETNGD
jgi:phosphoserine phosphatase